jgi:hypothetical protein
LLIKLLVACLRSWVLTMNIKIKKAMIALRLHLGPVEWEHVRG